MREDRFDDKIRELLNDAQEHYDGSSWDRLNERLDSGAIEDAPENLDFIPVIKEKLEQQRASVPEEHWNEMKNELDHIEERRERLFIIKALEAAVILLLFFTYYNYKWHTTQPELAQEYFAEVTEENADPSHIDAVANVTLDVANEAIGQTVLSSSSPSIRPTVNVVAAVTTQSSLEKQVNATTDQSIIDAVTDWESYHTPTVASLPAVMSPVALLEPQALAYQLERPGAPIPLGVELPKEKINEAAGWSVTVPFSYDVNLINTSLNLDYLSTQIQSGLAGTSVGLGVAYRKKNLQLESGIMYSEKTFVPGALTNYSRSSENSFLESQLEEMQIEQFQIPLTLKWYASPSRSSSLYAVAGFAINAITHNDYDITRTVQAKARLANTPVAEVFNLRELPEGLATGGAVSDNVYMTGIIGFGVESMIKNGMSWYLQPQYQHSFTSDINNLVTKINSLNIQAGLRFSF